MSTENEVTLIGNLGHNPEIYRMGSNPPFAKLQLATNKRWKKEGQKFERTDWHTVILSSKLADLAERYLSKGDEILIKGELVNHKWQDKEGRKRIDNVIRAFKIRFLRTKTKSMNDQPLENEDDIAEEAINSDIPF